MTQQIQKFVNFGSIGLVATGLAFAVVADSRAQDSVLNPGYIAGELTLAGEEVSSVNVSASSNDGFSGSGNFPGSVYELPVEGDKAYRVTIRGNIPIPGASSSYVSVASNAYHQVLADAEPTQVDFDRSTKRIDASISVVGGTLKNYRVTASATGQSEGSSETYQGYQNKTSVWAFEETAVFGVPMIVDDQVTITGYATLETDEGLQVVRELSGVNVDLVSADEVANDASWLIDLDLPTGSIAGDVALDGALADLNAVLEGDDMVVNYHRISASGNGYSGNQTLYEDGSYLFDSLIAGNYSVSITSYFLAPYRFVRYPDGPQGTWSVVSPPATTFVDVAPTLGAMAAQLTLDGFHDFDDFSTIRVRALGISGTSTQAGSSSIDIADGDFVLAAPPGEWAPYESIFYFFDLSDPSDPLNGYLQVFDYTRHPSYGGDAVVVSANQVTNVDPFSFTTVETRVFLDVDEEAGPEVLIVNGRVSGSSFVYDNAQLARTRYLSGSGPNIAMARPSVRFVAEPGVYAVTVSGQVGNATVTFGKFNLDVGEPTPTPASPEGCVDLACHQEVIVSDYLTVDFPNVTVAGVTAVTQSAIGPAPTPAFTVLTQDAGGTEKPVYWDITTNAQFDPGSGVKICFSFNPDSVDPQKLDGLEIHQWDAGPELWDKLVEAAGSDPVNGVVCGTTDNLSQFVIGIPTNGGPCDGNSDCDDAFPDCVDHVCWAGNLGNPCVNDYDCGDAPYCVADLCSMGEAGDICEHDGDCSEGAPYCAGGWCSAGELYDSCVYDSDCSMSAPYCAIDQCSEGYAGDLCLIDNDCGLDAPYCAIDQCSEGFAGAVCAVSNDCSDAAPYCGGATCNPGVEGDACDGDGDCSELAPFCVDGQCHDGGLDDPCLGDSDCTGDTPYCANNTRLCTTGEPGSACLYKSDCVSASCNYNTNLCN